MRNFTLAFSILIAPFLASAQAVPAEEENIPWLVTFGAQADRSWGDDDYSQTFFFAVPADMQKPFYLRVFDPECSGDNDELNGAYDTVTKYEVYGGAGCISEDDARLTDPIGDYKAGDLLASKTFLPDTKYDGKWYTFGPFNPAEGELSEKWGGYIFKLISEGLKGDDGNLYRYFMTTEPDRNQEVEGGNAFTFEYTFRLHAEPWQISHVYPYVDDEVVSLKQSNFDWDDDGYVKIISVVNVSEPVSTSGDNLWSHSTYEIKDMERGKSLDVQFIKDDKRNVHNNNVVFYIMNQYGELVPFYTIPLGGVPRPSGSGIATPLKK